MKFLIAFCILLLNIFLVHCRNISSPKKEPDSILVRTYNKLNSLKNIKYENIRELSYSSENYHSTSKWYVFYDFQTTDTLAGFKYQIDDSTSKQFFNGTKKFDLNKKAKTVQINDHPNKKSFSGLSALYNSIVTLKNVLPLIISDQSAIKMITDTIVNNNLYSLATINIGKRRIQNLGKGFDVMTTKSNFIYKIVIDKNNYLPLEVLQTNDVNNDFIKTSFSKIETNVNAPSEMSWYYSTYLNEFKPAVETYIPKALAIGSEPSDWKLELYNENKTISFSDLKGKVVLLDFWIKNCGPCIQSVPRLNELQKKFKDKNFKIISINSYDSKEDVKWFCKKHQTEYPVLLNGKPIAQKYGVNMFPTFFVIDKTGKIIYSNSGYDSSLQSKVEQVIANAL